MRFLLTDAGSLLARFSISSLSEFEESIISSTLSCFISKFWANRKLGFRPFHSEYRMCSKNTFSIGSCFAVSGWVLAKSRGLKYPKWKYLTMDLLEFAPLSVTEILKVLLSSSWTDLIHLHESRGMLTTGDLIDEFGFAFTRSFNTFCDFEVFSETSVIWIST